MTKYRIEIIAEGQHHLGHTTGNPEKDADHLLKMFLPALEKHGHKIHVAAFHHHEHTDIIVGTPEQLQAAPAQTESTLLTEVHTNVATMMVKLDAISRTIILQPTPKGATSPRTPKKIEGGPPAGEADKPEAASKPPQTPETAPPPPKPPQEKPTDAPQPNGPPPTQEEAKA